MTAETTRAETAKRALCVAAIAGFAVLALAPGGSLGSALETGWLVAVWAATLFGVTEDRVRMRRAALAVAGGLTALLWGFDLETWMIASVAVASVLGFAPLLAANRSSRERGLDALFDAGPGVLAPLALTASIAAFGGAEARRAVTGALGVAWPGAAAAGVALALLVGSSWVALALTTVLCGGAKQRTRAAGVVTTVFGVALGAALAARLAWVIAEATLPTDMLIWSEPPILLNLLKLHVGATFYGPMRLANSYSYSPMLELVQHCLLRPFGLDLSLMANRVLILCWQAGTVCLLTWAIWPRVARVARAGIRRGSFAFVVATLAAVVLSSLLAPFVHPDHPLMTCLALAVALLVAEDRMPRWLFLVLLFCAPILATCFKLTGAGFGLGLVLAFLWERRWREVGVLAVSGICALLTIPLFNATLGAFSAYAIDLQASHPIEWQKLWGLTSDVPGRLGLIALFALAAARVRAARAPETAAARRVAWLTFGAMTTGAVAFAKFGGRSNDLLPLSIGAVVVLLLSLSALFEQDVVFRARGAVLLPALALVVGLELCPAKAPVLGRARREIVREHALVVRTLRADVAAGGHPLLYSGTVGWLDAGLRVVPLDRAASAAELYLGRRPEVQSHLARLDSGVYDTIIASAVTFWPGPGRLRRLAALLKTHLIAHYRLVSPCDSNGRPYWPERDGGAVVILRRREPSAPGARPRADGSGGARLRSCER